MDVKWLLRFTPPRKMEAQIDCEFEAILVGSGGLAGQGWATLGRAGQDSYEVCGHVCVVIMYSCEQAGEAWLSLFVFLPESMRPVRRVPRNFGLSVQCVVEGQEALAARPEPVSYRS